MGNAGGPRGLVLADRQEGRLGDQWGIAGVADADPYVAFHAEDPDLQAVLDRAEERGAQVLGVYYHPDHD